MTSNIQIEEQLRSMRFFFRTYVLGLFVFVLSLLGLGPLSPQYQVFEKAQILRTIDNEQYRYLEWIGEAIDETAKQRVEETVTRIKSVVEGELGFVLIDPTNFQPMTENSAQFASMLIPPNMSPITAKNIEDIYTHMLNNSAQEYGLFQPDLTALQHGIREGLSENSHECGVAFLIRLQREPGFGLSGFYAQVASMIYFYAQPKNFDLEYCSKLNTEDFVYVTFNVSVADEFSTGLTENDYVRDTFGVSLGDGFIDLLNQSRLSNFSYERLTDDFPFSYTNTSLDSSDSLPLVQAADFIVPIFGTDIELSLFFSVVPFVLVALMFSVAVQYA